MRSCEIFPGMRNWLFPFFFRLSILLVRGLLPELKLVSDKLLPFLTAFYLLPNSWFAGMVAFGAR